MLKNIPNLLNEKEKSIRAIYVSSYIPRRCGIATYTKDLTSAINSLNPESLAEIIAMNDVDESYDFPWEVKLRINQNNNDDYIAAAHYINQSSADVVNLQHEFGLYGGVSGDYILPMIDMINKPIVSCFHSILPAPDSHQQYIIGRLIEASEAVVAMTHISKQILKDVYNCPDEKSVVIYHGVPDFEYNSMSKYKNKLGIETDSMLLMSGLIGPGKGIEFVIEAMIEIVKEHPHVKFYVLGQSHPSLIKGKKDEYREFLTNLVANNNLQDNVIFENRYLDLEELISYYKAADIFLTPHLDPQQPTSGTLAYALGAGKICISTPYNYAKEVLANKNGFLVPFRDSKSIADIVKNAVDKPQEMEEYKKNAYQLGKKMQWPRIAKQYLDLFKIVKNYE